MTDAASDHDDRNDDADDDHAEGDVAAAARAWDEPLPGARIVLASRVGTAVFVVTAVAAVIDRDTFGLVAVAVDLVLFLVGCVVFLWAFGVAVGRSRTDAIGIGGLYFLQGSAPKPIQVALLVPFAVQVGVALVAAGLKPFTSLAFGVLVPMFGLAQAGLWGARYGHFGSRYDDEKPGGQATSK